MTLQVWVLQLLRGMQPGGSPSFPSTSPKSALVGFLKCGFPNWVFGLFFYLQRLRKRDGSVEVLVESSVLWGHCLKGS